MKKKLTVLAVLVVGLTFLPSQSRAYQCPTGATHPCDQCLDNNCRQESLCRLLVLFSPAAAELCFIQAELGLEQCFATYC